MIKAVNSWIGVLLWIFCAGCGGAESESSRLPPWADNTATIADWPEMVAALVSGKFESVQKVLEQAKNSKVGFSSIIEQNAGLGIPYTAVGAWISGGYRAVAYWEGTVTESTLPVMVPADVRKGQDWFGLSLKDGRKPYVVDSGTFDDVPKDNNEIGLVYLSEMDPIGEFARLFTELRFESSSVKGKLVSFTLSVPEGMTLEYHGASLNSCEVLFDLDTGMPSWVEWFSAGESVKNLRFLGFQFDPQLASTSFDFQNWDYSQTRIVKKVEEVIENTGGP